MPIPPPTPILQDVSNPDVIVDILSVVMIISPQEQGLDTVLAANFYSEGRCCCTEVLGAGQAT